MDDYIENNQEHISEIKGEDIKTLEELIFLVREALDEKDIIEDYVANYGNKSEKWKYPEIEKYKETIKEKEIKLVIKDEQIKKFESRLKGINDALRDIKETIINNNNKIEEFIFRNNKLKEKILLLEACLNTSLDIEI